jgi:hypothetical protein
MLARKIQGVHQMAEDFTGLPLSITADEATELAKAIGDASKEFNVVIGGKTAAILNLAATCAMIYAPKVIVIYAAIKMQQMAAAAEAARDVSPTEAAAAGSPIPEAVNAGAVAAGVAVHPATNGTRPPATTAAQVPPTTAPKIKGRVALG